MPEIYTVKDRWGFWWSSATTPEKGYVCHSDTGAQAVELRTLDHIMDNYGISAGAAVQEVIEDDEMIMAWADDVIVRRDLKAAPKREKSEPVERGEDPSVFDAEAAIRLVVETDADLRTMSDPVRHQAILREFAKRIWDVAESAGADDISKCCGCTGSDKELNPFKERRESDE